MQSDEDQIRALLNDEAHALVMKALGKKRLESGDYAKVITVSFDTVVNYLLTNCSINDIAATKESRADGYYALPKVGSWIVYYQEKGCDFDRNISRSEKEVFSHFTKTRLRIESDPEI